MVSEEKMFEIVDGRTYAQYWISGQFIQGH